MSKKTVINVADGRELGHVCDMIFNNCGSVLGFVVPGKKSFFKSITSSDSIFIPWNRIIKIGSDVILTELVGNPIGTCAAQEARDADVRAYSAPQCPPEPYAQQPTNYPPNVPPYPNQGAPSAAQTVYHNDNKPEY